MTKPSDEIEEGFDLQTGPQAKLEALRAALIAGEESGVATAFDFDALIRRKRASRPAPE